MGCGEEDSQVQVGLGGPVSPSISPSIQAQNSIFKNTHINVVIIKYPITRKNTESLITVGCEV